MCDGVMKLNDPDLLAAVADFEGTYAAYADHQSTMERYWCLRWLKQEGRERMMVSVLKDGAVRFNEIPLVARVPELVQATRGTQVLLEIGAIDEIALEVSCRVLEVFAGEGEVPEEELERDDEAAEVSAEAAAEVAAEQAMAEATVQDAVAESEPESATDAATDAAVGGAAVAEEGAAADHVAASAARDSGGKGAA